MTHLNIKKLLSIALELVKMPVFFAGVSALLVVGSILWSNKLQVQADSTVVLETFITSETMAFPTDQSISLASIPTESTLVLFSSYRNPNTGNIFSISTSEAESFTSGCRDANAEYVTEVWYLSSSSILDFDVNITWEQDVEDVRTGIAVFSNTDLINGPVSNSFCSNDWTQSPRYEVTSANNDLIVAALGTYSGDSNILTPINTPIQEIWNQTGGINILQSVATWEGSSPLREIGWDMSVTGGWPWAIAGVVLPSPTNGDGDAPTINLTAPVDAILPPTFTVSGTVTDVASNVSSISHVVYLVGDTEPASTQISFSGTNNSESFSFEKTGLAFGDYVLKIYALDNQGNSALATEYPFEVAGPPSCVLENLATPTTDTTPTYTGTCTDSNGVADLQYRFYDVLEGDFFPASPNYPAITDFSAGTLGSNSISFSFTPSTDLPDGSYIVEVLAENTPGFTVPSGSRAQDYLVVEADDNRPPELILNQILPNPTVDTRPYISGACRDTYAFETNSTISGIQYRIDSSAPGDWVTINAFDGGYNSATESFSLRLATLSVGNHTVEVRCEDSVGNNTDDDASSESQTFEIVAPSATVPELVTLNEDFNTQVRNSIFFTDAIWGNGIVRLKEDIDFTTTQIDTNNFGARYGDLSAVSDFDLVSGTDNLIWYVKQNEFVSFNTVTEQMNVYSGSTYGITQLSSIAQVKNADGDVLVFVTSKSGLLLFNVTDNLYELYEDNGFFSPHYDPNRITVDTRDGRVGAYIRTITTNTDLDTNMLYLNTGTNFTDPTDDTVTWLTTAGGINMSDIGHIELDTTRDLLHMSVYGTGIGTLHDNNTPANFADDTRSTFADGFKTQAVTDIALDTTSHAIVFTNSSPSNRYLYAIVFDNESSVSLADATEYELASGSDLFNYSLSKVTFLDGPQYVGNQLFITTDEGVVLYYNTNDSYSDPLDDTVLEFNTANYRYPAATKNIVVSDYNTLYTVIDRIGLLRVDLDRAWEPLNTAVGISAPQEDQLYVNHISLEELDVITRIDGQGVYAPESVAGVNSFISVDDGLTWDEIEVGEQKSVSEEDYRVRFRLDLTTNPGTTAVVDTYSLSFGSYPEAPDAPTIDATLNKSTAAVNESFALSITAADDLGFPVLSYGETSTITLYDANTNVATTGLSGGTQAVFTSGEASVSGLSINKAGSFYIRVDDGTYQGNTPVITISQSSGSSGPVPTMSFSASKYEIAANERIDLNWSTTNLTEVTLNNGHGIQSLNGSLTISPDNSRTYTLTGTGPHGGLQSSLTITVTGGSSQSSSSLTTSGGTTIATSQAGSSVGVGGFEYDETVDSSASGELVRITSPSDRKREALDRETVRIQWSVSGNPDRVYIDYLDKDVSAEGSFDFIPTGPTKITITAYKNGEVMDTEVFSVTLADGTQAKKKTLFALGLEFIQGNSSRIFISWLLLLLLYILYRLLFKKRKKRGSS